MATYLKKGDKGTDVLAWQQFLSSRKIKLDLDSDFGKNTETATKLWQQRAGLEQTGVVDEMTIQAAIRIGSFQPVINEKVVAVSPEEYDPELFDGDTAIERINNAKLAQVAPTLQRRGRAFIQAANLAGFQVQIVQGLRTFAQQNALYAQGRTRPGKKVTNAIGGQSLHNYGLALDFAPVVNGVVSWNEKLYRDFGEWARTAGLEWGGEWKKFVDLPHVQDDEGMSLKAIQDIYRREGLAGVWARVK
jgi:peptidoglycan hydrolase-like protein with peptidoglycan-binding domain